MICPLWSIFKQQEIRCIKTHCGMHNLCSPDSGPSSQKLDECPKGHKKISEVTGSEDLAKGERIFACMEEGCEERWIMRAE